MIKAKTKTYFLREEEDGRTLEIIRKSKNVFRFIIATPILIELDYFHDFDEEATMDQAIEALEEHL